MSKTLIKLLSDIDLAFMFQIGYLLPVPSTVIDRYHWLHTQAPYSLFVHDSSDDQKFIYANQYALRRFKYTENEFLGLPSHFCTTVADQTARQELLSIVSETGMVSHYSTIRVDKFNQTFAIYDATAWQIYNDKKEAIGQAALLWSDPPEKEELFIAN